MTMIKSDLLHHSVRVMGSDDDQPIVQEIYAGFDGSGNLIITIDNTDYDDHRRDCSTWAVVERAEAQLLAKRLRVRYHRLPRVVSESMADWQGIVNATLGDVQACFKEITECLLDEGCRFRIERSCAPHGRVCC